MESIAYAQTAAAAGGAKPNMLAPFIPMLFLFVFFYFFIIRPQQKRHRSHQNLLAGLKKGDRVVTAGGILGTVMSIQDEYIVLKVGDGDAKIEVLKSSISSLRK